MTRSNLRLILFAFAVILACSCLVYQAAYADAQNLRQGIRTEYTVKSVALDQKADVNGDVQRGVIERKLTKDERVQNMMLNLKPLDYVKGPYLGRPNDVKHQRVTGDNIADPAIVSSLPFDTSGTTAGFIDDYNEGDASTSPDVVFEFTASSDMYVTISTCSPNTVYDTKLYIYNTASPTPGYWYDINDDAGTCVGSGGGSSLDPYIAIIENVCFHAGVTYYIVLDGYGGDFGAYELTIDEVSPSSNPGCTLTLPTIDFTETKACMGEYDPNGGLNEMGSPTDAITVGETVGGTLWSFAGLRDLDWYSFTLASATNIRFYGDAEVPWIILLVDQGSQSVIANTAGTVTGCVQDTLEYSNLPAGSYWVVMTTSDWFDDYLCCSGSETEYQYFMTMESFTNPPPANNDCADAIPVGNVNNLAFTTSTATSSGIGTNSINQDIFYCYTATCTDDATFSLCGSSFDTQIEVYDGCGCVSPVSVGYNDDACGAQSEVVVPVVMGQTYLVQVGGYGANSGAGLLSISCGANPITNDDCVDATPIGDVSGLAFTTVGATSSGIGTHAIGQDIFYCYTASCTGGATFSLCGSGFDTKIEVYDGCGCTSPVSVGYNDDACSLQSEVSVPVVAGHTYLVQVGGYTTASGTGVLTVDCQVPTLPNDNCDGALQAFDGLNNGDNTGALDGPVAPSGCGTSMYNDAWYYYTATCSPYSNGELTVTTCGTSFDTKLAVYYSLTDCTGLQFLACNDDYCGLQSGVVITGVPTGLLFYFQMASYSSAIEGPFVLTVDCFYCDPADLPCNDDCANLTSVPCAGYESGIPVLGRGDSLTYTGNNTCATDAGCNDPVDGYGTVLWEAFTITEPLDVIIDYAGSANNVDGGPFGNAYIIISQSCPCAVSPVFYTSYGFGTDGNVFINFSALPAGTYYYPVLKDAAGDAVGDYHLTVSAPPYCQPGANNNYEYISRVQLNTIDNPSSFEGGGYGDYSDIRTLVYKGIGYPAIVTNGYPYSTDIVGAWADWNLDFVFNPVTEFYSFTGGNDVDPTADGIINVPVSALTDTTRIRFQLVDGMYDILDPCGNVGAYGEYEDYGLIVEALPCGDVNVDDAIDAADVQYLIDFYFNQGPAPLPVVENGDANGDCCVGIADIVYLAEYVYRSGPAPICLPCNP